ncbi:hypothetical protein [Actinocorallia longicatena]|uniref:Carbohydrate binding protein n=1 Tax=Actinocorallia longicatena TaxID=111803 RepID=A0ABP6QEN1_9ACTN
MSPIDPRTEINLGTGWQPLAGRVQEAAEVVITRGYSDEQASVEASHADLGLLNRDGLLSPRNPRSPYFGRFGRNTPIRVSVPYGESYLALPGTSGSCIKTPDAAVLDITGDIDIRVEVTLESWRLQQGLAAKWNTGGNNRSWALQVDDDGYLLMHSSPDGTIGARLLQASTIPVPITRGRLAVRATIDVTNGTSSVTTFYTAASLAGPWTQLGVAWYAAPTSIMSGNADVEVGSAILVGGTPAIGYLHAFELRSGIGGTVVANPALAAKTPGVTSWADTAPSPRTWTVQGAAVVDDRDYRFTGEIAALPPTSGKSGVDVTVPVQAAGILRRLGAGASSLFSTLRRGIMASSSTNPPVAYWPCEDQSGSTQIASPIPGVKPMLVTIEPPDFEAFDGFLCSDGLPTFTNSAWFGTVPSYATTTKHQVRFLLFLEGGVNGQRIFTVYTTGSIRALRLFYGTGGTLELRVFDETDTQISTSGVQGFAIDGKLCRLSIELTQVGANVSYSIVRLEAGAASGNFATTVVNNQTIGRVSRVGTNPGGGLTADTAAIGHISVHRDITSIFDLASQLNAFIGETAGARIARLCAEEGVPYLALGLAANTVAMGPQSPATLVELLSECAAADMGLLSERRDRLGLAYRPRTTLYNQQPALTLTYGQRGLEAFTPVDDDDGTRNSIEVTRSGGSSATAVLEEGPLSIQAPPAGVGRYEDSVTVNVAYDHLLDDQAWWRLHLGTVDEARYPQLGINIRAVSRTPGLRRAALGMDIGDRLAVTNLPDWLPPDVVSQIVLGYTETLTSQIHDLVPNCTPESPYRVAILDDDVLGRCDGEGTPLVADVDADDTTLLVDTTNVPAWTTSIDEFPFDVRVGGLGNEIMSVTEVSGPDGNMITGVGDWTPTGGTIAQDLAYAWSGSYAALLTTTGSPTQTYARPLAADRAYVTVGNPYTVELWARSSAGTVTVNAAIDWFRADGTYITTSSAGQALTAGVWTRLRVSGNAPANAARASFGPTVAGNPPNGTAVRVAAIKFGPIEKQQLTVVRGVNGIALPHAAGSDVRLADSMVLSL